MKNDRPTPPTLNIEIRRSATSGGLEIEAGARFDDELFPKVHEPYIAPRFGASDPQLSHRQNQEAKGKALWHSLMPGRIGELLKKVRAKAQRRVCYLRLTFEPGLPERAALEKLPWEILFFDAGPGGGDFLGLSRNWVFLRTAETSIPCEPLAGPPPLRILVATASPLDCHPVGAAQEIEDIQRIWRDRGHVFVMPDAELGTFRKKVAEMDREGGVHIVHFIGHGGTMAPHDESLLLFQQEHGKKAAVTAAQLADQLSGLSSLRLVVLSACRSFDPPEMPGGDPCRSIALELAARKVPAVIGTTSDISIDLATRFSKHLHEGLANGVGIPEAVREARLALKTESNDAVLERTGLYEWTTPVLYLTVPDGDLLRFADPHAEKRPLHLGLRSREDPRRAGHFAADHVLDLQPLFSGREARSDDAWDLAQSELWYFLEDHCGHRLPLKWTIEAHLTLAFATGYLLHSRGSRMEIEQLTSFSADPDGQPWNPAKLWNFSELPALESANTGIGSERLAVAVSVSRDASPALERYCLSNGSQRWIGLQAEIATEVGLASIQGDQHCAALAKSLVAEIERRQGLRDVHIFGAMPISLAFQIGRLATSLGPIHLYEYDFGGKKGYSPSLVLTPEDQARPRRSR